MFGEPTRQNRFMRHQSSQIKNGSRIHCDSLHAVFGNGSIRIPPSIVMFAPWRLHSSPCRAHCFRHQFSRSDRTTHRRNTHMAGNAEKSPPRTARNPVRLRITATIKSPDGIRTRSNGLRPGVLHQNSKRSPGRRWYSSSAACN